MHEQFVFRLELATLQPSNSSSEINSLVVKDQFETCPGDIRHINWLSV